MSCEQLVYPHTLVFLLLGRKTKIHTHNLHSDRKRGFTYNYYEKEVTFLPRYSRVPCAAPYYRVLAYEPYVAF